jgi:alpha-N-arabinofuranosidase
MHVLSNISGVWDGISPANYSDLSTWPVVPEAELQPYIDDVLNEIEFIVGDAKTTVGGKLRASLGRTDPYALKFIEM